MSSHVTAIPEATATMEQQVVLQNRNSGLFLIINAGADYAGVLLLVIALMWLPEYTCSAASLAPTVEIEEDVYTFEPANNGAGPLWCSGSTCLVRTGGNLFASGLETLKDVKPLNNCHWLLFKREKNGWQLQQADHTGRTREPCPLVGFSNNRLLL